MWTFLLLKRLPHSKHTAFTSSPTGLYRLGDTGVQLMLHRHYEISTINIIAASPGGLMVHTSGASI